MPMRAVGSRDRYAGFTLVMFILPISTAHTSTHVHFCPEWTLANGVGRIQNQLTPETSQTLAYIVSNLILGRKGNPSVANLEFPSRPILYSIGIRMEFYAGPEKASDGIGRQKLSWFWIQPMPAFWKPGYSMVMKAGRFGSSMMLTIDV